MSTPAQPKITFMSISEFKNATGSLALEVIKNPNTDKLFLTNGTNKWKVQQSIDNTLPMSILIQDDNMEDCCLVNTTNNTVFSL